VSLLWSYRTRLILPRALPPPLRPSAPDSPKEGDYDRGALSDFSDYDSSDEDVNVPQASGSHQSTHVHNHHSDEDDPFADPFAD
jgi:LAS seventeen-binding protein 5